MVVVVEVVVESATVVVVVEVVVESATVVVVESETVVEVCRSGCNSCSSR